MSISVTLLTGEHAGETRVIPTQSAEHSATQTSSNSAEMANPLTMLGGFAKSNIRWEIDFDNATQSEQTEWSRADLVGRVLAALYTNRWVAFQGKSWDAKDKTKEEIEQIIGEIDDALSESGMMIFVDIDDDNGVWIGTRGRAHKV
jgi:hypothetical protein